MLHKYFCRYGSGCFNTRNAEMELSIDRTSRNALLNKFSFNAFVRKDGQKVFEVVLDTKSSPYEFRAEAPALLPRLIGQPSMWVKVDHELGRSLHLTSSLPRVKSLKVVKTAGNIREIYFNQELLFSAAVTSSNKQFKHELDIAGKKVTNPKSKNKTYKSKT